MTLTFQAPFTWSGTHTTKIHILSSYERCLCNSEKLIITYHIPFHVRSYPHDIKLVYFLRQKRVSQNIFSTLKGQSFSYKSHICDTKLISFFRQMSSLNTHFQHNTDEIILMCQVPFHTECSGFFLKSGIL